MSRMTTTLFCFNLWLAWAWSVEPVWERKEFAPFEGVVKNPKQGLTVSPRVNGKVLSPEEVPEWVYAVASVAYFRVGWNECVNERGEYDFDRLDASVFAGFRQKGLRLGLRVMAANRYSPEGDIFPGEKLGRKIPTIPIVFTIPTGGKPTVTNRLPVFWHESYIEEHGRLMGALGAWVRRHPEVAFVDFGGMGEWGEMHFVGWSPSHKAAHHLTEEAYLKAVFRMMEQMETALPRTTKAVCISPFGGLTENFAPTMKLVMDRAVRHGWWLRSDAHQLTGAKAEVEPFFQVSPPWYPWIIEPAGGINRDYYGKPYGVAEYMASVMRYAPRWINLLTLDGLLQLKPEEVRVLDQVARTCGSRIQAVRVCTPGTLPTMEGEDTPVSMAVRYRQNGTVPFHGEGIFRVRVTGDSGQAHDSVLVPDESISGLLPGAERTERLLFAVPKGFQQGKVRVSLALEDLQAGGIRWDNRDGDEQGWLPLGAIQLERGTVHGVLDLLAGYALEPKGPRIAVARGESGVSISGVEDRNWSYASITGIKVGKEEACRMVVRVRAWRSEISESRLYFKLATRKTGETREVNYSTDLYDFSREGTWQELRTAANLSAGEEISQCAIEKGRTSSSSIKAEIGAWTLRRSPMAPLEGL